MAITAWLGNYPYSDPIFQYFQVQQYLTQPGVNPAQTYTMIAPGVVNVEEVHRRMAEALALEAQKASMDAESLHAEPEDAEPAKPKAAAPRAPRKTAAKDAS